MTLKINISGKVQGVAFRYSAQHIANSLGINGYAKNLPDSSVEIIAQGEHEPLNLFIKWCHQGPSRARVDGIFYEQIKTDKIYHDFDVR